MKTGWNKYPLQHGPFCSFFHSTPRNHPGVGGLTNHPASPYSAPISVTNNASDLERPGGAEINKMRPGGTGSRVIFQDLAVMLGPTYMPNDLMGVKGSTRFGGDPPTSGHKDNTRFGGTHRPQIERRLYIG